MKNKNLNSKKGMAATEYVVGLILVAVAAIGVFTVFGTQLKSKIAQASTAIGGDTEGYGTLQQDTAITKAATTKADTRSGMKGDTKEEMVLTK